MTAPSSRDIATRLLAVNVVKSWLAKEERALRDGLAAGLMVGERVPGALNPDDEETLLGFVQLTKARESASITDPAAFLDWCKAVAPGEVVTREEVRSSFTASVLADVKSHGGWISPDGELLTPDGCEVRVGSPILTVKPTAEADALVAEALAARRLELGPGGGAA